MTQDTFTREEVLLLLTAAWSVSHDHTATVHVGGPGMMAPVKGQPEMYPNHAAEVQLVEYEGQRHD